MGFKINTLICYWNLHFNNQIYICFLRDVFGERFKFVSIFSMGGCKPPPIGGVSEKTNVCSLQQFRRKPPQQVGDQLGHEMAGEWKGVKSLKSRSLKAYRPGKRPVSDGLNFWEMMGKVLWKMVRKSMLNNLDLFLQEIWPTGPTNERTPKKPKYLIARSQLTFHGVRWDSVPFNFWWSFCWVIFCYGFDPRPMGWDFHPHGPAIWVRIFLGHFLPFASWRVANPRVGLV